MQFVISARESWVWALNFRKGIDAESEGLGWWASDWVERKRALVLRLSFVQFIIYAVIIWALSRAQRPLANVWGTGYSGRFLDPRSSVTR